MSKAMIVLEADRVDWDMPVQVPGGGLRQMVRLYDGAECKVVLTVNFSASSTEAREWALMAGRIDKSVTGAGRSGS